MQCDPFLKKVYTYIRIYMYIYTYQVDCIYTKIIAVVIYGQKWRSEGVISLLCVLLLNKFQMQFFFFNKWTFFLTVGPHMLRFRTKDTKVNKNLLWTWLGYKFWSLVIARHLPDIQVSFLMRRALLSAAPRKAHPGRARPTNTRGKDQREVTRW